MLDILPAVVVALAIVIVAEWLLRKKG